MKLFRFQLLFLVLFLILVSCKNEEKKVERTTSTNTTSTLKYAKGFEIQHFEGYKKLIIKAPYQNAEESFEYILTSSDTSKQNTKTIKTPINSIVVTSTTHIPMLELLNSENLLIGFPNTKYISSKRTRSLVENGKIIELGNEENINTEVLLNLNPNVVIGFSITGNNKTLSAIEKLGIPVILNGDWLEETPLGRAEWIKFFGVLLDKEQEADSIFNSIEKNYLDAKNIALKASKQPTIISGGLFKDVWYLPAGESFEATFLNHANTNYLWKNTKGKGSLSLNIENVFEKGKNADLWISPSYYKTLEELKKANDIYSNFNAFKTKNIYSFVNKQNEYGGITYYELAPARPDLVLKDLIKITHPNLLKDYNLTFYEKLN